MFLYAIKLSLSLVGFWVPILTFFLVPKFLSSVKAILYLFTLTRTSWQEVLISMKAISTSWSEVLVSVHLQDEGRKLLINYGYIMPWSPTSVIQFSSPRIGCVVHLVKYDTQEMFPPLIVLFMIIVKSGRYNSHGYSTIELKCPYPTQPAASIQ